MEQEIAGVDEQASFTFQPKDGGRPVHVWQATEAAAVEQRQQAAGTP